MFTVFVFVFKYRKSILYLYVKYTVDQVYLYLAMYRVFVFVIGILMLVFDPSLAWQMPSSTRSYFASLSLWKDQSHQVRAAIETRRERENFTRASQWCVCLIDECV